MKVSEFTEMIFNNWYRMKTEEMEEVEELLDSMEEEISSVTVKQNLVISMCTEKRKQTEMALRKYMKEFNPEVDIFKMWAEFRGIKEKKFLERWGINNNDEQ